MSELRILWLKTEFLHPVDKGGKIRSFHILRGLRDSNHVTYLTLDDGAAPNDALERAQEYCQVVEPVPFRTARKGSFRFYLDLARSLLSPLPYAVFRWRSSAFQQRIRELVGEGNIDLLVCDFLAPSSNVPEGLSIPTVLFQHNVEALIWRRHAEVARSWVRRKFMQVQARRMARFEQKECRRYDLVLAVSDADERTIRDEYD
ncbi:MAG: glycosyltransferase, partial [Gemmatimonadetes bacterium]|nr:glycosyltransferase [Gemmatimonadota bacterium]